MQDPEFSTDLAHKIKNEIPAVPAPPRVLGKKKEMDPTSKAFFRSIVLHAFLIVASLLYGVIANKLGWDDESANRLRQEIKSAIRVDVVDLPTLKKSDLQNVDLSQEVSKDPQPIAIEKKPELPSPTAMKDPSLKPEVTEVKKTGSQKLQDLKDRLKADQKRKEEIAKLLKKKGKTSTEGRAELAGNIKSEGYATTGEVAGASDVYVGRALAHVKRHWNVPGWAARSNYKARIVVKISPSGKVIYKMLIKPSGSNEFDQAVTRAVESADPFPMPPDVLRKQVLTDGIELGFPD